MTVGLVIYSYTFVYVSVVLATKPAEFPHVLVKAIRRLGSL